jgi:hypothetical protein
MTLPTKPCLKYHMGLLKTWKSNAILKTNWDSGTAKNLALQWLSVNCPSHPLSSNSLNSLIYLPNTTIKWQKQSSSTYTIPQNMMGYTTGNLHQHARRTYQISRTSFWNRYIHRTTPTIWCQWLHLVGQQPHTSIIHQWHIIPNCRSCYLLMNMYPIIHLLKQNPAYWLMQAKPLIGSGRNSSWTNTSNSECYQQSWGTATM